MGEAAAGEMAEGSRGGGVGAAAGGGGRSRVTSGRARGAARPVPDSGKGFVGPRVPGAVPSHRRLFDAGVSCVRGRSGTFSERGTERVDYEDTKMKSLFAS